MSCILVRQGENAKCSSLCNMETQGLFVDVLKYNALVMQRSMTEYYVLVVTCDVFIIACNEELNVNVLHMFTRPLMYINFIGRLEVCSCFNEWNASVIMSMK